MEKLLEEYRQGHLDEANFWQQVRSLWIQLENSSDPAEKLLQEILDETLKLTRGEITSAMYEKLIHELRSTWIGGE